MKARAEMTIEEWADLPEDEEGELVDGVLVEDEMPSFIHEYVVSFLIHALREWGRSHDAIVLGSEWKLAVAARRGRKPDVVVYLAGTPRPGGSATHGKQPPDVVIEVVTASTRHARRDRVEKFDEYAAFGVGAYWLVDPGLRSLEIFELSGGRYARSRGATAGTVAIPGLDGLSLDLDALWAEIDRLG